MYDERAYHVNITSTPVQADPGRTLSTYAPSGAYWNPGRTSQEPAQKQVDEAVKAGAASYD